MTYLTVEQVAAISGLPIRTIQHQASTGKYGEVRFDERRAGRGGRMLLIPLSGLPKEAQLAYLRTQTAPEPARSYPDDLDDLNDEQRREIGERLAILDAWRSYRRLQAGEANARQLDKQFLQAWNAVHPGKRLSIPTLYRWDKALKEGGKKALLPRYGQHRKGVSSVPDDLWEEYKALYLDENKLSHSNCYAVLRDRMLRRGREEDMPHEAAFRRRAKRELNADMLVYLREGAKAWYSKCGPYVTRDHTSVPPGAVFVMDHVQLDIIVKTADGRKIRPWLSAIFDFRTRRFVGWQLTENPTQYSSLAAFAMAAENPEIGIPDILLLDNGREYTAYSFAGRGHRKVRVDYDEFYVRPLVENLGIEVHFAIPENPTSKGDLERAFRDYHEAFDKLFGTYRGNRPENRPERAEAVLKDKGDDLPTLQDLFPVVSEFIINVVNERPHGAADMKGRSPRQAYDELVHLRPVKRVERDVLRMLLMPYAEGRLFTIQKGGISVWGQRYWSEILQEHLGEKVLVRYAPWDASRVYVFRADGSYLGDGQIERPLPFGASTDDLKKAMRRRGQRQRELRQLQQELSAYASGDLVGERIAAGKLRRERDQAANPAPRRVTQLVTGLPEGLRQAAKEVAAAQAQATTAAEHDEERQISRDFIMSVLNGMATRQAAVGDTASVRQALRLVK